MEEGYRRLEIYKLAHSLAIAVHALTLQLPPFESREEGGQIRRSSKSVAANIVEGFTMRRYKNEYLHHLYHAFGSSEETLEHLRLLFETGSFRDKASFEQLSKDYQKLNGMIFRFIQAIDRNYDTPNFLKDTNIEYAPEQ